MFKVTTRWGAALAALLLSTAAARAQTGVTIGAATPPNASAALDVPSTAKGLLPPRMTQAQRDAINPATTAAGLLVYNTSTKAYNLWDGTKWTEVLGTGAGTGTTSQAATTTTFAYTGGTQTYTVPAGITSLNVTAQGGSGGNENSGAGGRRRCKPRWP